ncbi:MAG: DUF1294 domain-containing protein [Bacillota bacterium]
MESIAFFLKAHLGALVVIAGCFNLFSAALFGIDKRRAIQKRRRIPEATLLWSAVPFSALGALIGMFVFRHKTRHPKFLLGIPLLLLLQLSALAALSLGAWRSLG